MNTAIAYCEEFVCWVPNRPGDDLEPIDHEHDSAIPCDWGWACNVCGMRVDDSPCPEHAPMKVSGLRLVECQTEPPHILFAHDREDYGHHCPWCWADHLTAELKPLRHAAQLREHRWCWFKNWAKQVLIWCRLMRVRGWSNAWGYCSHTDAKWRWS